MDKELECIWCGRSMPLSKLMGVGRTAEGPRANICKDLDGCTKEARLRGVENEGWAKYQRRMRKGN